MWVLRAFLLGTLCPTRDKTSLAPQKATSQNHAQKSPISLSVHQLVTQTDLHPLWSVHWCVSESPSSRSSSLLQDLGCAVLSLHVVVQENMCCVTLDHGGVQGGTCPKRVTSPHVLQRSRSMPLSIPGHSSALSISHESGWLGRSPEALPALAPSSPGRPPLSLQTLGLHLSP